MDRNSKSKPSAKTGRICKVILKFKSFLRSAKAKQSHVNFDFWPFLESLHNFHAGAFCKAQAISKVYDYFMFECKLKILAGAQATKMRVAWRLMIVRLNGHIVVHCRHFRIGISLFVYCLTSVYSSCIAYYLRKHKRSRRNWGTSGSYMKEGTISGRTRFCCNQE